MHSDSKLKVGEKYKLNRELGGHCRDREIFKCVYSGPNVFIMSRPSGTDWVLYYNYNHHLAFDEHVEPFWVVGGKYKGLATLRYYECVWTKDNFAALIWVNEVNGNPSASVVARPDDQSYYAKVG